MAELEIKYNELTAEQFIELWETVWDGDTIVAMARMNGDMGLNYAQHQIKFRFMRSLVLRQMRLRDCVFFTA